MMTVLLASCLALAPGQKSAGKLEVANLRPTYGYLGATRPKTGLLPGDVAFFSFDIKNLQLDDNGRAAYSIAIDVFDDRGQLFYQQKPYKAVAQNYFGGNSLPCSGQLAIPLDARPGVYTWKVTIQDRTAKTSVSLEGKGKVLKTDFGLVRVGTFSDALGRDPVPPVGVVGGSLYVNFSAVGFARNPKTKQPDIVASLRIKDDKGQPTFAKPLSGQVKEGIAEDTRILPLQFGLTMNRPGRFTVELTARCNLTGKTAMVTFPVRILPMD